jgi:hypothetical protein
MLFPVCLGWGTRGRGLIEKQISISSPGVALGEEDFFKKINFFPECCTRGRVFFKKTLDGTDGVKSSPSDRTTLWEGFPECTIFGTRGGPLSCERHPRSLFPECCTWGRLSRVFLGLPWVHLTLGEAGGSCCVCCLVVSAYIPNYIVNFTIITELVKWIYWIAYECFWVEYPELNWNPSTTRNYLICDVFSATFSENVTNVHCSPQHCGDFFNSSRFYDVVLFSSRMCIEAQNTTTIC